MAKGPEEIDPRQAEPPWQIPELAKNLFGPRQVQRFRKGRLHCVKYWDGHADYECVWTGHAPTVCCHRPKYNAETQWQAC